jgi:hypothetical protein
MELRDFFEYDWVGQYVPAPPELVEGIVHFTGGLWLPVEEQISDRLLVQFAKHDFSLFPNEIEGVLGSWTPAPLPFSYRETIDLEDELLVPAWADPQRASFAFGELDLVPLSAKLEEGWRLATGTLINPNRDLFGYRKVRA